MPTKSALAVTWEEMDIIPEPDPVYIYYKVFNLTGPCKSRHPVTARNPYISRIDANLVPPPHVVSSLVRCLCNRECPEGKSINWEYTGGYGYTTMLFKTITSPEAYRLTDYLSLLSGERPGLTPYEPVIIYSQFFY